MKQLQLKLGRARLAALGALLLSCAALFGCRSEADPPAAKVFASAQAPGELAELGQIGDFSLKDQGGATVTTKTLSGEPWVAAFFFTRCPVVCPRLTAKMREVQDQGKQRGLRFRLVSFSVDPDNDTPEQLTAYAKANHVDLANWKLLTGDYEVVKRTSIDSFKLALEGKADPKADHFGILHGSHLVLVDAKNQIRGFYRSEDADVVSRLLTDIKRLSE